MPPCSPIAQPFDYDLPGGPCARQSYKTNAVSQLYAFGGSGNFGGRNPPTLLFQSPRDIWQQLGWIVWNTVQQFTSGFTSGYIVGSIWTLLRGPATTMMNRALCWGLDYGVLLALWAASNRVTEFLLAFWAFRRRNNNNQNNNTNDKNQESSTLSRKQKQRVLLWGVVMRNVLLALYFNRKVGGMAHMTKVSLLYGGLTYFFVRLQQRKLTNAPYANNVMFGRNGMGGGTNVAPSADVMQEILQRMMEQQGRRGPPRPPPTSQSTTTKPKQPVTPSATTSSSTARGGEEKDATKSIRENAVDVEFEKVEDDGDAKE